MTVGEIVEIIRVIADDYHIEAQSSVLRNRHMNDINEGEEIDQRHIDAILIDFLNYFAGRYGMDYGIYTSDLKDFDIPKPKDYEDNKQT